MCVLDLTLIAVVDGDYLRRDGVLQGTLELKLGLCTIYT